MFDRSRARTELGFGLSDASQAATCDEPGCSAESALVFSNIPAHFLFSTGKIKLDNPVLVQYDV